MCKKAKTAFIIMTNACNGHCKYCFAPKKKSVQYIDTKQTSRAINNVSKKYLSQIVLTGGEPLMHENIFEFISSIGNRGKHLHMISNGSLLTAGLIKELKKVGMNSISLSCNGLNIHYDEEIGKPYFDFVKVVTSLKEEGLFVDVNSVLTRRNIQQVNELLDLAALFCVPVNIKPVAIESGSPFYENLSLKKLDTVDKEKMIELLNRYIHHFPGKKNVTNAILAYVQGNWSLGIKKCGFLSSGFVVGTDGDVNQCFYNPKKIGSIEDEDVFERACIETFTCEKKYFNDNCFGVIMI